MVPTYEKQNNSSFNVVKFLIFSRISTIVAWRDQFPRPPVEGLFGGVCRRAVKAQLTVCQDASGFPTFSPFLRDLHDNWGLARDFSLGWEDLGIDFRTGLDCFVTSNLQSDPKFLRPFKPNTFVGLACGLL